MSLTEFAYRRVVATRLYRLLNPASRVTGTVCHRNTASRGRRQCVLCGDACPGWSAKYPRTKQSIRWESEHDCTELAAQPDAVASGILDDLLRETM